MKIILLLLLLISFSASQQRDTVSKFFIRKRLSISTNDWCPNLKIIENYIRNEKQKICKIDADCPAGEKCCPTKDACKICTKPKKEVKKTGSCPILKSSEVVGNLIMKIMHNTSIKGCQTLKCHWRRVFNS
ncbi:Microsomal triglyceride transfer protein large subunit [Trichinella pseudospiralis]